MKLNPIFPFLTTLMIFMAFNEAHAENNIKVEKTLITPTGGVAAGILIAASFVVCFFGYRLFRPTLFMCGFYVGGLFFFTCAVNLYPSNDHVSSWIGIGCFIVGGIIVGSLAITFWNVGVFLIGAVAGVFIGLVLCASFLSEIYPSHKQVVIYVMIFILAIVGGCITVYFERPALIVVLSFLGSQNLISGIGFFAGKFPSFASVRFFIDNMSRGTIASVQREWWYYFAAMILAFFLGMFVQFRYTAADVHHRSQKKRRHQQQAAYASSHTPQEIRANNAVKLV